MESLARVYEELGLYKEALELERHIFERDRRLLGENHKTTVGIIVRLIHIHKNLSRDREAATLCINAMDAAD